MKRIYRLNNDKSNQYIKKKYLKLSKKKQLTKLVRRIVNNEKDKFMIL